jgi:hypothetical protein
MMVKFFSSVILFAGVLLVLISAGCHKPVVKAEPEPIKLK